MENYSKFDNINAVLEKAKKSIAFIEQEYNKSLHDKNVPESLLVEIKDFLGNLKSSLDYLVHRISNSNFPIRNSEKDFDNIKIILPVDIKNVIKKWQPFNNSNEWISWFNLLNNKSKHFTLVPQIRKETPQLNISSGQAGISLSGGASISIGQGASISIGGATIPGGQVISPNSNFVHDRRLQVEKIIWVSFEFDHENLPKGISTLPFLKKCLTNIKKIISEIEMHITE